MGSYSWESTIWFLLIMAGAIFTAASQSTNNNCVTEERYNDTFLEVKKDLSDLKEHQAYLEKIILTMADSLSSLTSKISPLCTDKSITGSPITTASPTSEFLYEFYAAARDGNIDYITTQLRNPSNADIITLEELFAWCNEDDDSLTVLHVAVREGHVNVIEALLNGGASPNIKDPRGESPIHLAAVAGQTATLRALLQPRDAGQVNIQNNMGYSPIHYAAEAGNTEALEVMIAYGANLHMGKIDGVTPLMWASRWGEAAAVNLLINAGARVGDADYDGRTALHLAAGGNRSDVVRLLLQNGADKDQTYHNDQWNRDMTPADEARDQGNHDLGDFIDNWQ